MSNLFPLNVLSTDENISKMTRPHKHIHEKKNTEKEIFS